MNKKINEMEDVNSIVDYEFYLATKYDFWPMNINDNDIWDKVIRGEGRKETHLVWYRKFIKKYAKKKLIPKSKLVQALIVAGCEKDNAAYIVYNNKFNELLFYFRKMPKKKNEKKPKIFYQGKLSYRERKILETQNNMYIKSEEEDIN